MPVAMRLKRFGRKQKPFYRVIIANSKDPRQGRAVDDIGYYDPLTEPAQIQINEEKALKWLKNGAQPSDTVKSLLSKAGILKKFHGESQSGNINKVEETEQVEKTEQSDSEEAES
ncbi:MAG: 30S ribosomal protein S16 [Candidatus Poribacteria bacterium]